MTKLWGGRFQKSAEEWVDEFGASIGFDQQLVMEDLTGSMAHVKMLGDCGILPAEDVSKIIDGLEQLKVKAANDELIFEVANEYSFESRRVNQLIGPVGGKIHAGRSPEMTRYHDIIFWHRVQKVSASEAFKAP
jgi:argininosuccinate lyase